VLFWRFPKGLVPTGPGLHAEDVSMNRKLTYTLTLFVFVVMWGVFGFATAPSAGAQPALQDTVAPPTVIVETVIVPGATQLVPVTGTDTTAPNLMMLLFYGFLGMLAIVLLVALFASANRTTYVRRDGPPPPPSDLP
jgi:ABC-type dipeptide/oligopeptide/nickel transport system permease subunit